MKGRVRIASMIVTLLVTLPPAAAFGQQMLKDRAQSVLNAIRKSSKAEDVSGMPMVFGHFILPEEIEKDKIRENPTTSASAAPSATVVSTPVVVKPDPPPFTCKGTIRVGPEFEVIIERGTYGVGQKVQGYLIEAITETKVTFSKDGEKWVRNAR